MASHAPMPILCGSYLGHVIPNQPSMQGEGGVKYAVEQSLEKADVELAHLNESI